MQALGPPRKVMTFPHKDGITFTEGDRLVYRSGLYSSASGPHIAVEVLTARMAGIHKLSCYQAEWDVRMKSAVPFLRTTLDMLCPSRPVTGVPRGMTTFSVDCRTVLGAAGYKRSTSRTTPSIYVRLFRASLRESA